MSPPRTVLIPLAAGQTGRVGVISAGPLGVPDGRAGLDPQIADLLDCGLYAAGRQAAASATLLGPAGQRALRLLPARARAARLTPVTPKEFDGLSEENNQSAELGLALGLVMAGRAASVPVLMATGALGGGADPARVTVNPVGGIDQKCAAAARFFQSAQGGAWADGIDFFTPRMALDGRSFAEAHGDALEALTAQAAQAGVTVRHRPIATLAEALPCLNLSKVPRHPAEWLARGGLALALAGAAATAAALIWAASPLEMRFAPIIVGEEALATPLRSAYQPDRDAAIQLPVCRGPDGMAQIAAGEELTFVVETDPTGAPLSALDFLVVIVGETSPPKLMPAAALPRGGRPTLTDGRVRFGARVPVVDGPDEEMKLVVLSSKLWALPLDAIEADLTAIHRRSGSEERINDAMGYLAQLGGGLEHFSYVTRRQLDGCGPKGGG